MSDGESIIDDHEMQELFSSEGSSDDEGILEIEKNALEGDMQDQIDQKMAQEELKTNIESRSKIVFSSGQEVDVNGINPEDVTLVVQRMGEIVRILNNLKELKEEGR